MPRRILHVDCDAFYASVEQRDNSALKGMPVAVGWSEQGGVVLTASYEARRFGVRSAMPSVQARRLCPELTFVSARMKVYRAISSEIRETFKRYTDVLEVVSIDEAYLDVSEPKLGSASGTLLGKMIKRDIYEQTGLTVSVGVAAGKFLAKLASDMNKPDGLTVITPQDAAGVLASLPVAKIHGVGPVNAGKLCALGVVTGADLLTRSEAELEEHFGKFGRFLYQVARGVDERSVRARERKSYGSERTFATPLQSEAQVLEALLPLAEQVASYLRSAGLCARTVTLKLKDRDYQVATRSVTPAHVVQSAADLQELARRLLQANLALLPARLVGVSVSNLQGSRRVTQPPLFAPR